MRSATPPGIRLACGLLMLLGLLQMAGDVLGLRELKGVGAATLLSPAPRVFSAVDGFETYSTAFALEWRDRGGQVQRLEITPEVGSRLRGPYNRRNVYGAALSYGPVLAGSDAGRVMLEAVLAKAFGAEGPLWEELGLNRGEVSGEFKVQYTPRSGSEHPEVPLTIEIPLP